jgi:hypothetical protein
MMLDPNNLPQELKNLREDAPPRNNTRPAWMNKQSKQTNDLTFFFSHEIHAGCSDWIFTLILQIQSLIMVSSLLMNSSLVFCFLLVPPPSLTIIYVKCLDPYVYYFISIAPSLSLWFLNNTPRFYIRTLYSVPYSLNFYTPCA